jgi:hypothetical protein
MQPGNRVIDWDEVAPERNVYVVDLIDDQPRPESCNAQLAGNECSVGAARLGDHPVALARLTGGRLVGYSSSAN